MSSNVIKKRKTTEDAASEDGPTCTAKDAEIAELKTTVATLQRALKNTISYETTLYASSLSHEHPMQRQSMPKHGMNPRHIKELLEGIHDLDNQPRLNTSSYVNIVYEPEERAIAMMGATVNLADASVYPASVSVHDRAVDWIASVWHCPKPSTTKTPPTGGSSSRVAHFLGFGYRGLHRGVLVGRSGPQVSMAKVVRRAPRPLQGTGLGCASQFGHEQLLSSRVGKVFQVL